METFSLTPEQLHILQHSLGVDRYGRGDQYRNHFCTGPESKDFDLCNELVALELMRDGGPRKVMGGMHVFTVTPAGIDAVAFQSPEPPKLTRSQKRYREYLAADCGFSFAEWLGVRK